VEKNFAMQNLKNSWLKRSYSSASRKWIAASLALLAMTREVLLSIITKPSLSLRSLNSKLHSSPSLQVLRSKAWQSIFATILFSLLAAQPSFSAPKQIEEVNYLASLRAAETNVRSGPGQNYPVKFTFKMRSIPVRVVSEYDNWNEIEDFEGQSGWVTQSLLTKKRTLLVRITKGFTKMHAKPSEKSRTILQLENNVVGDFLKCEGAWCAMKVEGKKGWVKKSDLFGA